MQTTHMAAPVLEVAHLEKVYGALGNVTRALNDVSFTVDRGEFVGIMGASGSGKSTLLNCVSTIDAATSGTIRINGQDVTRMKQAKLAVPPRGARLYLPGFQPARYAHGAREHRLAAHHRPHERSRDLDPRAGCGRASVH